jgi:hypothetical protein
MKAATLCAFVLTGCATTTTAFYPLDELQALDAPENRGEVLAHALEVAPSKRNDAWRGVVERAAIATLASSEVTDAASAERVLDAVDAQPQKFPFLARSPAWLAARADVGVKALPWVSREGERGQWPRRILEFAKKDAVTPHLAQRLAEEVLLKQLILSTAAPLYELAFEREGVALCDSANVVKMTVELAADGGVFKPALEQCWKQLAGPMVEAVKKAETNTAKLKLCGVMAPHAEEPAVKAACAE